MNKFTYRRVSGDQYANEIDRFAFQHGDDQRGLISDGDFDKLFDLVANGLETIGRFTDDGVGDHGEKFISSRYVDQLPVVSVVVDGGAPLSSIINSSIGIIKEAHRPLCVSFNFDGNFLAVFPNNMVIGTFEADVLDQGVETSDGCP